MKIFRFDIVMEGYPDVRRVLDISSDHTFEDLHQAILESVGFDSTQLASFYICNDSWERKLEITLIDMESDDRQLAPIMRDARLSDYLSKTGQKISYEYDFVLLWSFRIILEEIKDAEPNTKYPVIIHSEGDAPEQYDTTEKYPEEITEDDAKLIHELEVKNTTFFHADEEDSEWSDEYGVDEDDLFGSGGYSEEEDF